MKRTLTAVAAALILAPAVANAADMTTWTLLTGATRSMSSSCAAGTSCTATSGATGVNLSGVAWVVIEVCADSGQTITDGDGIQLYLYDTGSALGGSVNVTTYAVATGARCAWVQGDSPTIAIPMPGRGFLQALPTAMTVSGGALTVYIFAVDPQGNRL